MPENSPRQRLSPNAAGADLDAQLSADLARFRAGALYLLRFTPDQVAAEIAKLPAGQAGAVRGALQALGKLGSALEPLIQAADLAHPPEILRPPQAREPQRLDPERILVLAKRSKLEVDMERTGLSRDQLVLKYHNEGVNAERILLGHRTHAAAVTELQNLVGTHNWHLFWDLGEAERLALIQQSDFQAIIALGGDDTLKAVTPYVHDKFVALFNSDQIHSVGAMAACTLPGFRAAIESYARGDFLIEEWTRLAASIEIPNGAGAARVIETCPAINEISILDQNGKFPMRGTIEWDGKAPVPLKGTGLLIGTGAGSTGWLNSASAHLFPLGRCFPRTMKRAEFLQRERYRFGESSLTDLIEAPGRDWTMPGVLREQEVLTVTSSSNHTPILTVDCTKDYAFPRGAVARIRLADEGLKFLRASGAT